MQKIKQVIKWGGMPVGIAIYIASVASNAKEIATWGLPIWSWYLIGFLIFTASSLSIIIGLWRKNRSLKRETISETGLKLMEYRKDYRAMQSAEVSQIPTTLKTIWDLVKNVTEEKKKGQPTTDKLLELLIDLLGVDKDDPILNESNYSTEDKIRKILKRVRKKMGLRRSNVELEAKWRKRIRETMDDYGIGLMLKRNNEYIALLKQLEREGTPISTTTIYHKTTQFLENLSTLYSIRLLVHYGGTTKRLHLYPREMRDALKHLEDTVDVAMWVTFAAVKKALEEYSIGEEPIIKA